MKEFVFAIPEIREDELIELLSVSGINSYYFEKSGKKNFLKLYLDKNEIPYVLRNEILVSSSEVDPSSWDRAWGENYNGDELTGSIFVLPAGNTPPDKKYKTVIEIDQYDAFGDGHHPTTRLCGMLLEEVISNYSLQNDISSLSMLDIGTGSGILAIAAWTMGIRNIELFDYDPVAVEKARKNLKLNGINSLTPFSADIYQYTSDKKYDVITANLLSRLIEDNISKLIEFLKPEGIIIVSGISTRWAVDMKNLFISNKLEIIKHKQIEEWHGFIMKVSLT